jgi:hypothetical protein
MRSSPFQCILGADFECLPPAVRRVHGLSGALTACGFADITPAPGLAAWLICALAGLPRAGRNVPVTVSFHPDGRGGERWKRRFGARRYASTMRAGRGETLLIERIGPFDLFYRLTPQADGLCWQVTRWRFATLPLPTWTLPTIRCVESGAGERFFFDIDIAFPMIGPVIHYRGWLDLGR